MEIKIGTSQILQVLYVLSWIIFVGVCIEAGGIIFNTIYTLFINPVGAGHFWQKLDLSGLYKFDPGYFAVETLLMAIVASSKAFIFYLIVKFLHDKKLDIKQPFSHHLSRFVFNTSYLALLTGGFSFLGVKYVKWFAAKGVNMPDIELLGLSGADVWIFMSVVLFVIAQIFKRGIEIQTENDLTI
jgi:hypothetical protein